ncbi:uncharacterized protein LOC127714692 isoform X1 [Mytilus californianus]|uniref:uncharacterized protein LOC127714692 isoform X1 n=1 Tax=Mytilus californianus TaxID=6549 RepID=UPI002245BB32|nr:uncharacterized protein LOC127714692 isoform X1 [Mytilus californianus]
MYPEKIKSWAFGMLCLLCSQCSCFELVCPNVSQMKLRAEICKDSSKYMCFCDMNKQTFKEYCNETDEIQQEGFKTVFRGSFDGVPCDENHYQPFKYSSSNGDTCVFLKSACNEEGQIESTDRQTTTDRTCRCDYRYGFSFVSNPNKFCFCVPSEEDCSCYYKECGKDQVLTPDYVCMNQANITGKFRCPLIDESNLETLTKINEEKVAKTYEEDSCHQQIELDVIKTSVLMVVIGTPIGLIYLVILSCLVRHLSRTCSSKCKL